jgi:hypothetical protein
VQAKEHEGKKKEQKAKNKIIKLGLEDKIAGLAETDRGLSKGVRKGQEGAMSNECGGRRKKREGRKSFAPAVRIFVIR